MTRHWKVLGLTSLLAAALAAAPAFAADPEKPTTQQQLDEMNALLRAIKADLEVVKREVRDMAVRGAAAATTVQDLRDLQDRLAALEQRLRSQETVARRFSFPAEAPARRTGVLKLENRSAYGATVTVNGIPYFAPAFETSYVRNVPTGPFTYEVSTGEFGVLQPSARRTLNPGEVFVVYINP